MRWQRYGVIGLSAMVGLAAGAWIGQSQPVQDTSPPLATSSPSVNLQGQPVIWSPPANLEDLASSRLKQLAFLESIASFDSNGCAELAARYSKGLEIAGTAGQRAYKKLFAHWTKIDPAAALQAISILPSSQSFAFGQSIDVAISGWASTAANDSETFSASLSKLETLTDQKLRSKLAKSLLGGIDAPTIRETIDRANQLASKLPKELTESAGIDDTDGIISTLLSQWYGNTPANMPIMQSRDPLDLYQFATAEIADPELQWKAQEHAMRHLAQLDPELAAETLEKLGVSDFDTHRIQLLSMIGIEWVNRDPEAGLKWFYTMNEEDRGKIMATPNGSLEPRRMGELVQLVPRSEWPDGFAASATSHWLLSDHDAAIEWFSAQPEATDPEAVGALLGGFAIKSLPALMAITRLENVPADKFGEAVRMALHYSGVTEEQRVELATLRESLGDSDLGPAIDAALMRTAAASDPLEARDAFEKSPGMTPEQRKDILETIGDRSRFHESISDAVEWMEKLPDADVGAFATTALPGFLNQSPAEAIPVVMEWFNGLSKEQLSQDFSGKIAKRTVRAMVQSLGDAEAAANWAATGLPEPLRRQAIGEAVAQWAALDPVETSEWLSTLPEGSAGDTATAKLVDEISGDPERAFSWAATISETKLLTQKLEQIVEDWSIYAPDDALQKIEDATLNDELRATLIRKVNGDD